MKTLRCNGATLCTNRTCPHIRPHDPTDDCWPMTCSGVDNVVVCIEIAPTSPDPARVAVLTRPGGRSRQGQGKGLAPGRVSEASPDVQMDQADRVRIILEDFILGALMDNDGSDARTKPFFKQAMQKLLAIIRGTE